MRILTFACSLVCLIAPSTSLMGQAVVPDISRWSGGTALSQAQGFSMGDPLHLTWGIVNDGLNIPGFIGESAAPSDLKSRLIGIYGSEAAYLAQFQNVFDRWGSISGLEYSFQPTDDNAEFLNSAGAAGVRADIRIGGHPIDGNSGILAYNFFPNAGDMVIDTDDTFYNNTSNNSIRFRNVISHEHGHGIGMPHVESSTDRYLMEPFIQTSFDGPQHHDILMAHRGYGDVNEKSNGQQGNDSVALATGLGLIADGASAARGQDGNKESVADTDVDFVSIDDQSDTDFWSFEIASASLVDINLEALGYVYNIDEQGGSGGGDFDTRARSNLDLALFDTDGTTLLGSSNVTGLGGNEQLTGLQLDDAGTYFVRVRGADNDDSIDIDTQFYGLTVSVAAIAIPEPATFGLLSLGGLALISRRRR
ncbi:MAG: matrixin family metalloprotease [Mariniblastus sp.]|nr:matrixin family metalloprotease [Mariniblastus sp.]